MVQHHEGSDSWAALCRQWRESLSDLAEENPTQAVPHDAVAIAEQAFKQLVDGAMADAAREAGLRAIERREFNTDTPGQADLTPLLRASNPHLQGISVGVERLFPQNVVATRTGPAPRLWLWQKAPLASVNFVKAWLETRYGQGQGDYRAPTDQRRRGYLQSELILTFVPEAKDYAGQLQHQLHEYFGKWLHRIAELDEAGEPAALGLAEANPLDVDGGDGDLAK